MKKRRNNIHGKLFETDGKREKCRGENLKLGEIYMSVKLVVKGTLFAKMRTVVFYQL
jgi:hypothetical protein